MKQTLYLKLYENLREKIIGGGFKYMEKLPSKRTLAADNGVSVITAEHALELLLAEGYIKSREKSGYYCIFKPDDKFLSAPAKYTPFKHENIGNAKSEFPVSVYTKAVRAVLSEYGEAVLQKSENGGTMELKSAIARYLKRSRNIDTPTDNIIIGAGAEYLYSLIVALLGRNRIYAAEKPSYEQIEKVYISAGVRCELLPLCDDGIDSEALKNTNASVLHITPYRSFPSGISASVSKRLEYLRWARAGKRYIVEDDFGSEFTVSAKPSDTVYLLANGERVIYLNTFSMSLSAGIRVAFMVLPEDLANAFKERLGFYSCTVPTLEQYVLARILNGGDFERHINRIRRNLRKDTEK